MVVQEPTRGGSVVRVYTPRSKYPEVWVASYINGGRWYPDTDSWLGGSARHDHPDGCDWHELSRRGRIVLLAESSAEAYEAGWRAACEVVKFAADEVAGECPGPGGAR